jgi:PAS domain S-box-containing protein
VERSRPQPPILPEVREAADRLAARRALTGVPVYPFVVLSAGVVADFPRQRPYLFILLGVVALALAALRTYLTLRFEDLYHRRPEPWRISFYGSMIANAVLLGCLFGVLIVRFGPRVESFFILSIAAVLTSMAILLYAHSPRVVFAFSTALLLPVLLQLGSLLGDASLQTRGWESLCIAIFLVYLTIFGAQLYRERWSGLTSTHLLSIRAAELERARDELRQAHTDLERQVDERAEQLRKANQDYRRIFENAHDAIFVLAPDETILNVNRRACEIYGWSREELLGMSLAAISENVEQGRDHVAKTMSQGVFHVFETTQFRRDGSRMYLEVNASLIEYEGEPAILSINRDVTERRRAEELRRAKDAAEQADRAKSRFLANMSHEIRTPMAGVLGLVDLLLKTDLTIPQRDYVDLVQSSATSLLRLIDDILDFSKIEAGRLELERVPFDLPTTLGEIVELLRFQATAQGTELALDVDVSPGGVPRWVWGDPGRLRQVLTNLVGNAVKFTEGGEVEVSLRPLPDGRLRFAIEDTGIGIPAKVQERLFELFYQADSSTSRRYGGSGLGLAISQRIVRQMGGEIRCESRPGEGSTFSFTLGLEPAPAPVALGFSGRTGLPGIAGIAGRPGAAGDLAVAPRRPAPKRRILVAEDNLVNQLVVTQHLVALGHEVLAVNNGREALEVLEQTSVDLILMDCQMPELDGYEATRRIRQGAEKHRQVPIVALTAHAMREDLERCLAVGMNDTITKPFREEVLRQKLDLWLEDGDEGTPDRPPQSAESAAPSMPARPTIAKTPQLSPATPVFDGKKLAELRQMGRDLGRHDILRELAATFQSQNQLAEMRAGLEKGDRPLVGWQAHSLKGSSAVLGALRLVALCEELEQLPSEVSDEICAARIAGIEEEYQRVLNGLLAAAEES